MMLSYSSSNIVKCIFLAFLLPVSIVFAQSSVREDPLLSEYRMLERLSDEDASSTPPPRRVDTVAPPERNESLMNPPVIRSSGSESTPRSTPLPLHMNPNAPEPWDAAPQTGSIDVGGVPSTPPVMLNPRVPGEPRSVRESLVNASSTERIPVASVLMIESESRTVSPDVLSALTQVVWNEFQRSRHTRLQRLRFTRHVLSQFDLTPSDPYKVPPSPQKIAQTLNADYLVMGTAEKIENINLLELFLYDVSANRIVASRAARSTQGYENLLQQIPEMVRDLQKSIPAVKTGPARTSMAPGELSPRWIDQDVQARLRALAAENARLRRRLEVEANDDAPLPTPAMTPEPRRLAKLPPVRHGNKEYRRMKYPAEASHGSSESSGSSGSHSSSRTPEPTPRPPRLTSTPGPTPTPDLTPEPPQKPLSAEEKKARQAQAQEQYEEAMRFPQDSEEALPALREAVELDPDNALYKEKLVEQLYKTGKFAECARRGEWFERGGLQSATVALYTSSAYTSLQDYDKALEVVNRLLQREPKNGYALFNKGLNLSLLGRKREAQAAFERFLEVAQDKPVFARWVQDAEEQLRQIREGANQ